MSFAKRRPTRLGRVTNALILLVLDPACLGSAKQLWQVTPSAGADVTALVQSRLETVDATNRAHDAAASAKHISDRDVVAGRILAQPLLHFVGLRRRRRRGQSSSSGGRPEVAKNQTELGGDANRFPDIVYNASLSRGRPVCVIGDIHLRSCSGEVGTRYCDEDAAGADFSTAHTKTRSFLCCKDQRRMLSEAMKEVEASTCQVVVQLGDLFDNDDTISVNEPLGSDLIELFDEYRRSLVKSGKVLFVAVGNHDATNFPHSKAAMDANPNKLASLRSCVPNMHNEISLDDTHTLLVANSEALVMESTAHWRWLEEAMTASQDAGRRVTLMMHRPPFLLSEDEPDTGYQWPIPQRKRLLAMVQKRTINNPDSPTLILAGHVHEELMATSNDSSVRVYTVSGTAWLQTVSRATGQRIKTPRTAWMEYSPTEPLGDGVSFRHLFASHALRTSGALNAAGASRKLLEEGPADED